MHNYLYPSIAINNQGIIEFFVWQWTTEYQNKREIEGKGCIKINHTFRAMVYIQLLQWCQNKPTIYINIYLSVDNTHENPLCGSLSHLYLQDIWGITFQHMFIFCFFHSKYWWGKYQLGNIFCIFLLSRRHLHILVFISK